MSKYFCYVISTVHDTTNLSYRFLGDQDVYRLLDDTDAMVIRIGTNQRAILMSHPEGEDEVVWRDISEFKPESL